MILRVLTKCLPSRNLSISSLRRLNQLELSTNLKILQQPRKLFSSEEQWKNTEDLDVIFNSKYLLYPDSGGDAVVESITRLSSVEEFSTFIESSSDLQREQLCQLVLSLWDLKATKEDIPIDMLNNIASKLEPFLDQLTLIEACCCFSYLNRLGLTIRHPAMERLCDKVLHGIQTDDKFPLSLLTKFSSAINSEKGLYGSYLAVAILPVIRSHLEACNNAESLFHLTDSLNNITKVVSLDYLEFFKNKVNQLLDENLLNETTLHANLKVINFLNYPHWSYRNSALNRRLLLEVEDNIQFLKTKQLMTISRAFQSQFESARLVPCLVKRAQNLLKDDPSVELLSLAVLNVTPDQRQQIAEKLRQFLSTYQITSSQSGDTLQTVFKIIRLLKISDVELCDQYWSKVLNEIYGTKEKDVSYRLMKHIHKYMFFNNNLGGTYRHKEFESSILKMVKQELKHAMFPKDTAIFSSFIIAYGSDNGQIEPAMVEKIEEIYTQFSVKDCLHLSRGIAILQESRKTKSHELKRQIDKIDKSLNLAGKKHLNEDSIYLTEISGVIRSHNSRKSSTSNFYFNKLINLYDRPEKFEMNSRVIREICSNLTISNFRMDSMCDRFVDYILENHDHTTGDTVEKILTCCYNFSYFPEKIEVFDRSSEIIVRDFNYMPGLSIVQSLLALIFYKSCPQQLIAMVFSSEFIKRLEQEIKMCYSKNTYPTKVMNQVMQLNRAVCLDCPEVNVKWFQQSFMEAQGSKLPFVNSRVHGDLRNVLLEIVEKPELLMINRVTPYGYQVDFEISIDQYNRFVRPLPDDYVNANYNPNLNRIAILLLNNRVLCDNDIHRVKGSELLRMRHLEMMGYRVVHVKSYEFNSLYENVSAKIKYLKNLLQLTA